MLSSSNRMFAGLPRASGSASWKGTRHDCIKGLEGRGVGDEGGENGTCSQGMSQSAPSPSSPRTQHHTPFVPLRAASFPGGNVIAASQEGLTDAIPSHAATAGGHGVQHVHDAQARGAESSVPSRLQHLRVSLAMPFVCRQRSLLQIGRVSPPHLQMHVVCPVCSPHPRCIAC